MGFKFNPLTGQFDLVGGEVPADVIVSGSVPATDNSVVRYDGTSGTEVQDSLVLINDSGDIDTPGDVNGVSPTELGYVVGVTSSIQDQLDDKLSTALTDSNILVGNVSNEAAAVAVTGDISISNAGITAIASGVIVDADINASAGIDASKIADGSVSSTEFQYLDGVTSDIQTQLDGTVLLAGRSGGQSINGGTGAGDDLSLTSTSNGTKGNINLGSLATIDEVNNRLGIGIAAPTYAIHFRVDADDYTRGVAFDHVSGGANSLWHFYADLNSQFSLYNPAQATSAFAISATDQQLKLADANADGGAVNIRNHAGKTAHHTLVTKKLASQTGDIFRAYDTDGSSVLAKIDIAGVVHASNIIDNGLTTNTVIYADGSKQLVSSSVTNTELSYVSGVTSAIQDQLDDISDDIADLVTLSGVSAGSTDLGSFSGSTISDNETIKGAIQELETALEAIPDPITYKGTWDAATNTPTLDNSDVAVSGFLYQVSVAGSVDFGAGSISFEIGDKVVNNGTVWDKWDMTDSVTSVNGQNGVVVLDTDDVDEGATNLYFTNARAQDAVGFITGDIAEASFTAADNQVAAANVTGLAFSNGTVRSFEAIVSVTRDATYAQYKLNGIQRAADWVMSQSYIGDVTGLIFTITSAGQVQYQSSSTGSTASLHFRAITTSI